MSNLLGTAFASTIHKYHNPPVLSELVVLDIGDQYWCKICARTRCPVFKEGAKDKALKILKTRYVNSKENMVTIDIFRPDDRYLFFIAALSHVGCASYSPVDPKQGIRRTRTYDSPDFLEIVEDSDTQ